MPTGSSTHDPDAKQRAVLDQYIRLGCNAARVGRETSHSERTARRAAKLFPDYVRERQREVDRERRTAERDSEDRARAAQSARDAWVDGNENEILDSLKAILTTAEPRVALSAMRLFFNLRSKPAPTRVDVQADAAFDSLIDELLEERS